MNIPDPALLAMIEQLGMLPEEIDDAHVLGLEAAAPYIAAQALRDAANSMKDNLSRLEGDKWATPWLARVNDIGLLLKLAEELSPQ